MTENSPQAKKNGNFFLVSVILLALIAGLILFFFNKNRPESTQENGASNKENVDVGSANAPADSKDTFVFADLMNKKQGSYRCEISNDQGVFIYYFNDQEMLIDVEVPEMHTLTLVKEDYTYNWDAKTKVGTKFSNDIDEAMPEDEPSDVYDEEMLDEEMLPPEDVGAFNPDELVCRAWPVDRSVFQVPSDVTFQDLSEMQQQFVDGIDAMGDYESMGDFADMEDFVE